MEDTEPIRAADGPRPPRRSGAVTAAAVTVAIVIAAVAVLGLVLSDSGTEEVPVLAGDGLYAEGDICGYIAIEDGAFAYTGEGDPEWSFRDLSLQFLVEESPGRYCERPFETSETRTFDAGPGYFEVVLSVDGEEVGDGLMTVDGDVTRTYRWEYCDFMDGETHGMEVGYSYRFSDYMEFSQKEPDRSYDGTKSDARFLDTGPLVESLVENLSAAYRAMEGPGASLEDERYVNYLLSFVQVAIVYPVTVEPDGDGYSVSESDLSSGDYVLYGQGEHWSFPIETLHLSSGDCKNSSLLFNSILSVAGFDSYIVTLPDYVLCAVELDDVTEYEQVYALVLDYRQYGDRTGFAYSCETTFGISIPVGYVNDDIGPAIEDESTVVTFVPAKAGV